MADRAGRDFTHHRHLVTGVTREGDIAAGIPCPAPRQAPNLAPGGAVTSIIIMGDYDYTRAYSFAFECSHCWRGMLSSSMSSSAERGSRLRRRKAPNLVIPGLIAPCAISPRTLREKSQREVFCQQRPPRGPAFPTAETFWHNQLRPC